MRSVARCRHMRSCRALIYRSDGRIVALYPVRVRRIGVVVYAVGAWMLVLGGSVRAQETTTTTLDPALVGGVVSGTVTIDGLPAADACVSITDGQTVQLGTTVTGPTGTYEFTGLYTGDLWVWVSECVLTPPRFEAPAPVGRIVIFGGIHAVVDFALVSLPAPTSTTTTVAEVAGVSTTLAGSATPTSLKTLPVTGAGMAPLALVAVGLVILGVMTLRRNNAR